MEAIAVIKDALFGGEGLPSLRKGMDVSRARHRVTAENVANALTPGYRAKRVAFEEYLDRADGSLPIARTREGHISSGQPLERTPARVVASEDPVLPNGINNVDIENEMAVMGWNRTQYAALTRFASRQYRLLSEAIGRSSG
jgi:flagellar basal-body rod protein FlgB